MSLLLAIHSYPGGSDACARHWPYFLGAGADRIVGIGTAGGGTRWPAGCESVEIGINSYINGQVLPKRLLDTVSWFLTQPEDHLAIVEYDTIILQPLPRPAGIASHRAGGQLPGARAKNIYHNPWMFDRAAAQAFVTGATPLLREVKRGQHEASPDVFLAWACERLGIPVNDKAWPQFTRNTVHLEHEIASAREARLAGVHVIHGIKTQVVLDRVMGATLTLEAASLTNDNGLTVLERVGA